MVGVKDKEIILRYKIMADVHQFFNRLLPITFPDYNLKEHLEPQDEVLSFFLGHILGIFHNLSHLDLI
jgi:hypothetical protein